MSDELALISLYFQFELLWEVLYGCIRRRRCVFEYKNRDTEDIMEDIWRNDCFAFFPPHSALFSTLLLTNLITP